jgi:hypothetical protein
VKHIEGIRAYPEMWNEVSINWVGETNYWLAETCPRVEGRNSSSPPKKRHPLPHLKNPNPDVFISKKS